MIFGSPGWAWPALVIGAGALALIAWSYLHPAAASRIRSTAFALKVVGVSLLCLCLVEPLQRKVRAQPGANQLHVLIDGSQSLTVRDRGADGTRADLVRALAADTAEWMLRAGQDFDVQRHAFAGRLRSVASGDELAFDGDESALGRALGRLAQRSTGRPVAAIVLMSDGISTDSLGEDFPWEDLPPVYPVAIGGPSANDVGIARVDVSQTNFEESPVTLRADVRDVGLEDREFAIELRDEGGALVERKVVVAGAEEGGDVRFHAPSETAGVHFFQLEAELVDRDPAAVEATPANNTRWAVVDRGAGPYRVLYVSGRPNWEFKFLRRAIDEDPELDLIGLLRIARRQPKLTFRAGDRRNALWDGFDDREADSAEQYDEPVLLRLGTRDEFELRGGFPRTAEDLFPYHALIIDDLEAEFFTRDQMTLIEEFVGRRGGGLLALGGPRSFAQGGYERTPLGDLLPVYLDVPETDQPADLVRLRLTREGWLEPWIRLRSTEDAERARLETMPAFWTLSRVRDTKPGATTLVEAYDVRDVARPALTVQRFGKGRSAALMVGDLWRWDLHREAPETSDLGTAWRQILRWLVSDVPQRVELQLTAAADSREVLLRASLHDAKFDAVHNARVRIEVRPPAGEPFRLEALPSSDESGVWEASFTPLAAGPYRASLSAEDEAGKSLGGDEGGWVSEPAAAEYQRLDPDRGFLEEIARRTGGELLEPDELSGFAESLAADEVPITQEELDPLWHRPWFFLIALACLCAEWGLRRYHGLP